MNGIRVFMGGLARLPLVWQVWVGILAVINGLLPLVFWDHPESPVILVVFLLCLAIGMALAHVQGFTKLLGLMHFPWFVLVFWLFTRLAHAPPDTDFGEWLRAVIAVNLTSLVLDVIDVARYASGDREPS